MLKNYLTEIISKADWRIKAKNASDRELDSLDAGEDESHLYRKKVTRSMDFVAYKDSLKQLKAMMKKLNHGVFKSTLIFDYEKVAAKQPVLSATDKLLIGILRDLDYTVSEESYMLGFVQKNNKSIMVNDILNSLDNKNIESMEKAYEKTKNENIKKQIDVLTRYNDDIKEQKESTLGYQIAKESKVKLVVSIQPRIIASQSTKVGWRSCMNLDDGEYNKYVGSGISQGVMIVFVTRTGDEHTLESPMARILLKPLKNQDGDLAYAYDQVYGTAPAGFVEKVKALLNKTGKYVYGQETKPGVYNLDDDKVYLDNDLGDEINDTGITVLDADGKAFVQKIKDLTFGETQELVKGENKELSDILFNSSDTIKEYLFLHNILDYDDASMDFLKTIKNPSEPFLRNLFTEADEIKDEYIYYLISNKKVSLPTFIICIEKYDEGDATYNIKAMFAKGYKFTEEEILYMIKKIYFDDSDPADIQFVAKKFIEFFGDNEDSLVKMFENLLDGDDTISLALANKIKKETLLNVYNKLIEKGHNDFWAQIIPKALTVLQYKKIINDIVKNGAKSIYTILLKDSDYEQIGSEFVSRLRDLYDDSKIKLNANQFQIINKYTDGSFS